MKQQKVILNLIILNQRGKPLFVLENTSQDRAILAEQTHSSHPVQAPSTASTADGPSLSELVNRLPEHVGGQTLAHLKPKE